MSVKRFCQLLVEANYGKNDKKWFPRWLRRYGENAVREADQLTVTEEQVLAFSRSLRDSGTPARHSVFQITCSNRRTPI